MTAKCHPRLLSEIDQTARKHQRLANINLLLDDDSHLPQHQRITALSLYLREMIEQQTVADKTAKQSQQTITSLKEQLAIKDTIIQKYRTQLLQQKEAYLALEGKLRQASNQLRSAEAQIIVQEELIDHHQMASTRKVLSMQSQVNYLLAKDCQKFQKDIQKQQRRASVQKQNGSCELKKKDPSIRRSMGK